MSAKSTGARKWQKLALLVAFCVVAVGAWWVVPSSWLDRLFGDATDALAARHGDDKSSHGAGTNSDVATIGGPAPERTPLAAATDLTLTANAIAALPRPGHVTLHVVDARTHATLGGVRAKFLGEKRYAEFAGEGQIDLELTPGRWEGSVVATGYEPTRLDAFDVASDATTRLETVALSRGSGVVEGHVVARHLAADGPVTVQLFGDGRSRCDECRGRDADFAAVNNDTAQSAACCGYTDSHSELSLANDRRFRFPALAAGVYWIRAFDPAQRIVASRKVEVARGGDVWLELDVSAPTSARFELRHERGGLFTGDWTSVHSESVAPIVFQVRRNGKVVGEGRIEPTADDVRATIGAPLLPRPSPIPKPDGAPGDVTSQELTQWISTSSGQAQHGITLSFSSSLFTIVDASSGSRADRDRQEGDSLEFDTPEPEVGGAVLAVEKLQPDEFLLKPLPRDRLSVVVSCGHYLSEEIPLDLSFERFNPVVVTMVPTPEWSAQFAEIAKGPPAACAACHNGEANVVTIDGNNLNWLFSSVDGKARQGQVLLNAGDGRFEIVAPDAPPKK
jgi:hypothetical protein